MKLIVTNIQHFNGRKFGYSKKHGWLSWHESSLGACFCGWLPSSMSPAQARLRDIAKATATIAR